MDEKPNKIVIVGCGPGSEEYVTPAARAAVAQADVLVGSRRLMGLFPEGTPVTIAIDGNISALLERIASLQKDMCRVVVLVSGDPGLCSLAANILRRFGRDQCDVIPGISSVQVAFARLGLDWTNARIVSAHGRSPEVTFEELGRSEKIAILAGTHEALRWSARAAEALQTSHVAFLGENLTLDNERWLSVTPEPLDAIDVASLSIVLLIQRSLLS